MTTTTTKKFDSCSWQDIADMSYEISCAKEAEEEANKEIKQLMLTPLPKCYCDLCDAYRHDRLVTTYYNSTPFGPYGKLSDALKLYEEHNELLKYRDNFDKQIAASNIKLAYAEKYRQKIADNKSSK